MARGSRMARARLGIGKLGLRLSVAFLGVALAAIIILSGLTEIGIGDDISGLAMKQELALSRAVAVAAGALYAQRPAGWHRADLAPVLDLAAREGASTRVRAVHGRVVGQTPGFAGAPARQAFTTPVVARGRKVGLVTVKFSDSGLGAVVREFEAERVRASLGAAAIVALIALVVSLVVSRQIASPLERVLSTIRARGVGDRSGRIGGVRAAGVVHELSVALDQSSDAIDHRDQLQRNLVANIAHELRTPVAILQATYEAMLDGITTPTAENLRSARDELLRLRHMIGNLQKLASAEAAAVHLDLVPQDLSAITADATARLAGPCDAAQVSLIPRLTATWIMCDPDRLREVIMNLLTNALKYTPAGGSVVVEAGPVSHDRAGLSVSDTGIGIPPDELPRVTERFFRGQRSSRMAPGSGIGLTIVAELVRAQRGTFQISSEPGRGTRATLTFPLLRRPGLADPGRRKHRSPRHPEAMLTM